MTKQGTARPLNLLYRSRIPYLTAALCILAVVAGRFPSLASAWQLDRGLIRAGEISRLLTCHLSHWSADHFIWDFVTFAALGFLCETWSRTRFAVATIGSGFAISVSILFALPQVSQYRGLSGIDCALFTLLATNLIRERRGTIAAPIGSLLLAAAFLKVSYELGTGTTLFVDNTGVTPLPLAHIAGGVTGILVGLWPTNSGTTVPRSAKVNESAADIASSRAEPGVLLPLTLR